MRGSDERTGELFSYVNVEERVPKNVSADPPTSIRRRRPMLIHPTLDQLIYYITPVRQLTEEIQLVGIEGI
jgi:hypothetical protein